MTVRLSFKWYDLWVGAFISFKMKTVFICLVPMVVIEVSWAPPLARKYDLVKDESDTSSDT